MPETRKCPYCAEEIRAEAVRCPHCRSRVATTDHDRWYRNHPERRVAGVAAAVAHALALPIMGVRLGFVVLTFVHLLGPIVYGALWLLVPFAPGDPSPLERALAAGQDWFAGLRVHCRAAPPTGRRPAQRETRWPRHGCRPGKPARMIEVRPAADGDRRGPHRGGRNGRRAGARGALPAIRAWAPSVHLPAHRRARCG